MELKEMTTHLYKLLMRSFSNQSIGKFKSSVVSKVECHVKKIRSEAY